MSADRTEAPTPRRLREARRRGEVAMSLELCGAAAFAGGLVALAATAPALAAELARLLRGGIHLAVAGVAPPADVLRDAAGTVLRLVLPVALAAAAAGGLTAALQAGFAVAPESLRPRLDRIDPVRGLRRLVAPAQLLRAPLAVLKAAALLLLVGRWAASDATGLGELPRAGAAALLRGAPPLLALALRLLAALAIFGLLDWALARRRHLRALRMTRDEVRREQKEEDGDPAHRAERRRLHRALLDAAPVSRATVVVVNPTHVAVALHHRREGEEAPRLVAKGTGRDAARIRSAARRAGVPIVQDVPLARALHRLADVGEEIPEELYEAAAAVLAHLYGGPPP